jgi:Na+/proline symporter
MSTSEDTSAVLPPDISLDSGDVVTLVIYFIVLFAVSYVMSNKSKTVEGYFSADHEVNWIGVSLSMFASNIGSEHYVGLCGVAAFSGFAIGWFELGAVPCLFLLGFLFLPVYLKAKVATVP